MPHGSWESNDYGIIFIDSTEYYRLYRNSNNRYPRCLSGKDDTNNI